MQFTNHIIVVLVFFKVLHLLIMIFLLSELQIWEFITNEAGRIEPQCVCDLTRHQSSVSAVRWSPDGKLLASADLGEFSKDTN